MEKIAVIGAGMVGRAWAIVFARAGRSVALYDTDANALENALVLIAGAANDLHREGLVDEDAQAIVGRITATTNLGAALAGAAYAQENAPETLDIKRALFGAMDAAAPPETIFGSSTSGIRASQFSEHLKGRARCLVAHPVNPPSVVPLVELAPAPWTDPGAVEKVRQLMAAVGQQPITVQREIDGFILNRLQGALLNEAMRLIADGYVTTEDLDKTVKYGLGLRWSFMGPMETIDLNAPGGVPDYSTRYGPIYHQVAKEAEARPWDDKLFGQAAKDRRATLPMDKHVERQQWRDRRLMALAKHKKDAAARLGD
ncbi:MAG: 3-hydroxyacyl-CoA dehydrogenase [Rhodospirillaceae bacterium]